MYYYCQTQSSSATNIRSYERPPQIERDRRGILIMITVVFVRSGM